MARLKEKIAYALGAMPLRVVIVWKGDVYRFSSVFYKCLRLSFADAAVLMLVARMFDVGYRTR